MTIYLFCAYFVTFLLYSFIGWCIEVFLSLIRDKKFVDRGFLLGPYCPIYGYGMFFIVFLLKDYTENFLVLYVLSMVICLVLEYLTSYIMELIFKARWWDYSNKKYNINGRICLEYGFLFGLGGTIIMYVVHPFVLTMITSLSKSLLLFLGILLFVIYVLDNIITFSAMYNINDFEFKKYVDSTEDISNKVKDYLLEHSFFTNRLVKAFPNVHMRLEKYRKKLKR